MKRGAVIFGILMFGLMCLFAGLEIGWRQRDAQPEKIVYLTKTCPNPQQFAPRWDCSATEARAYCTTCLRRHWL